MEVIEKIATVARVSLLRDVVERGAAIWALRLGILGILMVERRQAGSLPVTVATR